MSLSYSVSSSLFLPISQHLPYWSTVGYGVPMRKLRTCAAMTVRQFRCVRGSVGPPRFSQGKLVAPAQFTRPLSVSLIERHTETTSHAKIRELVRRW